MEDLEAVGIAGDVITKETKDASHEAPWSPQGITVVSAHRQTAGRGRLDHKWITVPSDSFICSFVSAVGADLARDPKLNGWIPMIAGLSVLDAVRAALTDLQLLWTKGTGVFEHPRNELLLKWPNDIVYHGHKLGGILTQVVPIPGDSSRVAIVFGVGLNIDVPPDQLPSAEATSFQLVTEPQQEGAQRPETVAIIDTIAAGIVDGLGKRLWQFGLHPTRFSQDLHRRVSQECWTIGHSVRVRYTNGKVVTGTARGITSDASLSMVDSTGRMRIVHTADVGVLPAGD
ncbi:MAG: biotin--[acetyl-CoA-carboxylase] ligase [Bifidobacterium sp.]|nr:biotin--[acetyl-CoA-carboxylase] ligase [Bifidobacterium sp.]